MSPDDRSIHVSFSVRMALVIAAVLLGTLASVQFLNQSAQQTIDAELERQKSVVGDTVDQQFKDVIAATNFGITSISERDFIYNLVEEKYAGAINRDRIRHILVVQLDGKIVDASERDLRDKVVDVPEIGTDPANFVGGVPQLGHDPVSKYEGQEPPADTYWFIVRTRDEDGERLYYWIAVVVSTERVQNSIRDSQKAIADVIESTAGTRLRATLGIFTFAGALLLWLVWRFTRPVRQLAIAARRVAEGDLDFTVDIRRRDEMGMLAKTFNQMIGGLKTKRDLEERLSTAERAAVIGRLTSAIAHEIRNPLNFINLSIDHVRSKFVPAEPKDHERFDRLLGSIKEELGRLNRLVTDVLNFGRPANLATRVFDLREIVEQMLAVVRTQAEQQGVELLMEIPQSPVEIEADAEKLKSCLSNIVINAVQAMPDGGRLTVLLESDSSECVFHITDTGVGIPDDALDRIFEPYYSTKDTGTGLGLAVTKKIIDEHGGHIRVKSAPGEGTTFSIELPKTRPRAGRADQPHAENRGQKG